MIEVLRHRGPDDTGFYDDEGIGLANARLSIIDIEGGHQPIRNEDGTIHVTYNGEIYNFRDLRSNLESAGHRFSTRSDTEIIVHGYEQYGEEFPSKLNGMFAIALWDSRLKKLILVRDRMGVKPLYYALQGNAILFASEIKGILQAPIKRAVDKFALFAVLNVGYPLGDRTLIEGVHKLPPSCMLTFNRGKTQIKEYWQMPTINRTINESLSVENLRQVLEESIQGQLVADVPVGCFLSGGLDTGAIVAFASKASDVPLKTFCMGFGETTDEFKDARAMADHFGTEHHELTVDSSLGMKLYPKMIWHMEAPKYNLYPWFVCELVRRHVKVCLSGNGGDEVFGGYYTRYQNALRITKMSHSPLAAMMRRTGSGLRWIPMDIRRTNRLRVLEELNHNAAEYFILAGGLPDTFNSQLFGTGGVSDAIIELYSPYFTSVDLLQDLMNAELRTKLVDDLLSVDDTMSMAHSLELRVPLLDNRIVDLMSPIPWQFKYALGTHGKLLLRKAIRGVLPEETMRKAKWGFSVNVSAWYKGELGELVHQILPDSEVIRQYFNPGLIQNLVNRRFSDQDRRYQILLWQLLGFHFWHRIFIDSEGSSALRLEVDALVA